MLIVAIAYHLQHNLNETKNNFKLYLHKYNLTDSFFIDCIINDNIGHFIGVFHILSWTLIMPKCLTIATTIVSPISCIWRLHVTTTSLYFGHRWVFNYSVHTLHLKTSKLEASLCFTLNFFNSPLRTWTMWLYSSSSRWESSITSLNKKCILACLAINVESQLLDPSTNLPQITWIPWIKNLSQI